MFIISAFADEIDPDPVKQLDVLESCGVRHVELRSIYKTNVLDLTDEQVTTFKDMLDERGMKLSAIGSPIGKVLITEPFEPHLRRFQRALELCEVFATPRIRLFSYYKPEADDWSSHRQAVLDRMRQKLELAAAANVVLLHENEHRIYGEAPENVVDLFESIQHPNFAAIYDPANYVHGGYDPWQGWEMTRQWTVHFHIKDWVHGEHKGVVAGAGQGRVRDVLADANARGYRGFATLEPHLLGGGPTGGITGPELFPSAVDALRGILDSIGAKWG